MTVLVILIIVAVAVFVAIKTGKIKGIKKNSIPGIAPTPSSTLTPTLVSPKVYSGDVWFGTSLNEACKESAPQQYLYWSGSQALYNGLIFYTDSTLLYAWNNTNLYAYCRGDNSGGEFNEMYLSGSTVGDPTGTEC